MQSKMYVVKRSGQQEEVRFDKVQNRIKNLSKDLDVNPFIIAQRVCARIYDGVTTAELDDLAAQLCTSLSTEKSDYALLADRITISNNHKNTSDDFIEVLSQCYKNKDKFGVETPLISKETYDFGLKHKDLLNSTLDYSRDFLFDYFGFKTLERAYLLKVNGKVVERPQHLFMRVSMGLYLDSIENVLKSYEYMSNKYFTHATPTLFNSGTNNPCLLSCYLTATSDSIPGIYKNLSNCAAISAAAGGISVYASDIRSRGACIHSTNEKSNGIIPMLRVYNETAKYVNQSGKRTGSIAVYLEPHHPDIFDFLELRKNNGIEDQRCRDLFLALTITDFFMEKLMEALKDTTKKVSWYLMDPDECKGLNNSYGDEYKRIYQEYLDKKMYREEIDILQLWRKIVSSQTETGTPYILFKDRINRLSNQKNLGTIRSSNLCAEIVEYSDENEYACCCLSSICLPSFIENREIKEKIKIYTKTKCGYCKKAKLLLNHYEEICLDDDEERMKFYEEMNANGYSVNSVPQIFIGDKYIGGYEELNKYMNPWINYDKLKDVCETVVRNLNQVVDINVYPVIETELSNFKHRPIGVGVQGFIDFLYKLRIPFESDEAKKINREIFEKIQYFCLLASNKLAKERHDMLESEDFQKFFETNIDYERDILRNSKKYTDRIKYLSQYFTYAEIENWVKNKGKPKYYGSYLSFRNSPLDNGVFQFELANEKSYYIESESWDILREEINKYGVRNSLCVALMPTASTSQIMGYNECFEPITSNIYTRRTLAGDFVVINKYLVRDLEKLKLWSKEIKNEIISDNGSIQNIEIIPSYLKLIYKTAWEIKQKAIIDLSSDRTPFVCQTQSMNLFFEEPSFSILTSALLYGWQKGLKTGCYYIRSRPKIQAQQFTIDPNAKKNRTIINNQETNYETCESCSG